MKLAVFSAFPHELRHIFKKVGIVQNERIYPFEIAIVRHASHEIILVQTGVGAHNTEAAFTSVFKEFTPDFILSAGFGGALYDDATIGELICASKILLIKDHAVDSLELPNSKEIINRLSGKITLHEGCILTIDRWMKKSELKKILPHGLVFPVCDMETFFLAKLSAQKALPFFAARSITDLSDEDIPYEFLGVSDESGTYRLSRALRLLFRKPWLIPHSIKLGINSSIASKNLWHMVKTLIEIL